MRPAVTFLAKLRSRRGGWVLALVWCTLLQLALVNTRASHEHERAIASATPSVHQHEHDHGHAHPAPVDRDEAHRHTGDIAHDLLTLGHCHLGSGCPSLPAVSWVLALPQPRDRPALPWPAPIGAGRLAESPFRPPIA